MELCAKGGVSGKKIKSREIRRQHGTARTFKLTLLRISVLYLNLVLYERKSFLCVFVYKLTECPRFPSDAATGREGSAVSQNLVTYWTKCLVWVSFYFEHLKPCCPVLFRLSSNNVHLTTCRWVWELLRDLPTSPPPALTCLLPIIWKGMLRYCFVCRVGSGRVSWLAPGFFLMGADFMPVAARLSAAPRVWHVFTLTWPYLHIETHSSASCSSTWTFTRRVQQVSIVLQAVL